MEEKAAKAPTRYSELAGSAIDSLKAGRDADGNVGLWMNREDLSGKGKGPLADFLKANAAAVRQPEYSAQKDEKGNTPRTGNFLSGKEGVDSVVAGFGEKSQIRRVYFDVDAVAAKYDRARKSDKDATLGQVLAAHDARDVDRDERLRASRAASNAQRKARPKEKEGASL